MPAGRDASTLADAPRQSGIEVVGCVPWGTHFCQFYQTGQDLVETLVPYFREGLMADEFCMWVTSPPLQVDEAKAALRAALPDLDDYIAWGQLEILDYTEWYIRGGRFDADEVLQGWVDKHDDARRRGYEGLRLTGNTFWLEPTAWDDFTHYEEKVDSVIGQYRMLAVCTYSLEKCGAKEITDVIANHEFALVKRSGRWQIIESARHKLTEGALRESEERLRNTLESISDAFATVDREWRYTYVNDPALANLRRTRDQLIGKSMWEVFPEAVGTVFWDKFHEAMETQTPVEFEAYYEPYDMWDDVKAYPSPQGLTLYFHDITEHRRTEVQQLYHQTLLANLNDAVVATDADWVITAWNKRAEEMLGWKAEEVLGRPGAEVLHIVELDDPPSGRADVRASLAATGQYQAELTYERKDSSHVVVEVNSRALRVNHGPVVGYVSVLRDITERKRAQAELAEQKALLQEVLGQAVGGIMVCDAKGKLLLVNKAAADLNGLAPGDAVDSRKNLLTIHDSDDRPVPREELLLVRALRGETVTGVERRMVQRDGRSTWALSSAAPVTNARGEIIAAVSTHTDITGRKRDEVALAEQKALLQAERDLLRVIMENTQAHLAYLDPDFNFVAVNSTYAQGSGHTPEDLIGKNHFFLFPDEENQAVFERVRDAGEAVRYLARPFIFEDQPERGVTYWDWTLIPVKDFRGSVQGLVLSLVDVTERVRSEEVLRRHHEELDRAQAVAHVGSWRLDVQRDELRWSDETHQIFGIPKGTPMTLESFLAAVHPEDREYVGREWDAALAGQPYDIEHRIVVGSTVKWVRELAELEIDENGVVVGGFGTVQDITQLKRAQESIERERLRLQTVVDTSPVGIILVDAAGRITLVNREAQRLVGVDVNAGDPLERFTRAAVRHRSDGTEYEPGELPIERALYQGETVRAEQVDILHEDGTVVPHIVDAVPLYGANGEITGAVSTQQDITPLQEMEKLRNEFLGMVSHELRTPLTAIKGSAATALGSPALAAAHTHELFQIIDEQADRLRDLVDNLLDITRIEAGTLSVEAKAADLHDIMQEALESFARGAGQHKVHVDIPAALPAVKADRHRVGQVITNLLSNAAKFSPPEAPISVSVEAEPLWVTVRVRDEGRGIAEADISGLFKKFSRPHERAGVSLPGHGLGLAICKGIVEAHGGRIWAESAGEGRGATFSFTLPTAPTEEPAASPDAVAPRVTRPGQHRRILALDDEVHVLRYLQHSLTEAGYEPVLTSDPSEVTKLVELNEPDLILLDLRLPGTSGFEVLEKVREVSEAPVVFLTASGRDEDAVRALREGADDYITKPFSPSELFARIDALLRRRAVASATKVSRRFVLGDLRIDFGERRVTLAGRPVPLSPTEYRLLRELAAHAGRVLTYDQILRRAWGPEYSGETELVRAFIRNLRHKLGDDARNPKFILTERGVGYQVPAELDR